MADMVIRNIPDEIHAALREKASADGKGLETWVREQLSTLAALPTIRRRYSFKAVSENGAYVTIKREYDRVQHGAKNCNQAQFNAFNRACDYVGRNELGDYEAAYKLLIQNFDDVFPS
jgi:plasmid stability protein